MAALEVLLCDNHLLAVAKPAGVPVVPDSSGDESLLERAKAWVKAEFAKPGEVFLGVVHRLDRPVSGVVLFARTSKGAARLSAQFRSHAAHKRYLAVVEGSPSTEGGELEQWLVKDESANRVRVVRTGTPGAQRGLTVWKVLARRGARALLQLDPATGRPHQLRIAAAEGLGTPILGDLKYGAPQPLADRSVALHAFLLEVDHPTRPGRVHIVCRPPDCAWWSPWGPELSALADEG